MWLFKKGRRSLLAEHSEWRRGDISSLLVNGDKITEDKAIADTFNDFSVMLIEI